MRGVLTSVGEIPNYRNDSMVIIIIIGETDSIMMFVLFLYVERSKPAASSNSLSTGAAVGATAGVMAAVVIASVAVGVIWMWRRQWILPCASTVTVGELFIHSGLGDLKILMKISNPN